MLNRTELAHSAKRIFSLRTLEANTEWFIYALKDPDTGLPRYVGFTVNPSKRLQAHIAQAKRDGITHRARWILKLLRHGKSPVIEVLESGYGFAWREAERTWLEKFRNAGLSLVNVSEGGQGPAIGHVLSAQTRAKIVRRIALPCAVARYQRKFSKSGREHYWREESPSKRSQESESLKKRWATPEGRERLRLRAKRVGFKHSEESKALIGRVQKDRRLPDGHKEAIAIGLRRFYQSSESNTVRAAIKRTHTGKIISDETKARMSAAQIKNLTLEQRRAIGRRGGGTVGEEINMEAIDWIAIALFFVMLCVIAGFSHYLDNL